MREKGEGIRGETQAEDRGRAEVVGRANTINVDTMDDQVAEVSSEEDGASQREPEMVIRLTSVNANAPANLIIPPINYLIS